MAFGDIIRSAALTTNYARGIGGTYKHIWHAAYSPGVFERLYELSVDDFSIVQWANIPDYCVGVGGSDDVIWGTMPVSSGQIAEFSVSDLSEVRRGNSPGTNPSGCGGYDDYIYHCDTGGNWNARLNPSDFSVHNSLASPSTQPIGIGGGPTHVWHRDSNTDRIYELQTNFAQVQYFSFTTVGGSVGGDDYVIWGCTYEPKVYQFESPYPVPSAGGSGMNPANALVAAGML